MNLVYGSRPYIIIIEYRGMMNLGRERIILVGLLFYLCFSYINSICEWQNLVDRVVPYFHSNKLRNSLILVVRIHSAPLVWYIQSATRLHLYNSIVFLVRSGLPVNWSSNDC